MNERFYKIINKGIPSQKNLSISLDLVCKECVDPKNRLKVLNEFRESLTELNEIIYDEFKIPFYSVTGLLTFSVSEDLEMYLVYEPSLITEKIMEFLGIDPEELDIKEQSELKAMILDKAKKLSNIKIANQLEREFPGVFKAYKELETAQNNLSDVGGKIKALEALMEFMPSRETELELKQMKESRENIRNYLTRFDALRHTYNAKTFAEYLAKIINNLYRKDVIYDVMNLVMSSGIEFDRLCNYIDLDKFELLLAAGHLSAAYHSDNYRIENISYVTTYLREYQDEINDDLEITMPMSNGENISDDEKITRRKVYDLYKQFLLSHPEVKITYEQREDFAGKTPEEVQDYIASYASDLEVSWDILGEYQGTSESLRELGGNHLTDEEKERRIDSLERIFDEKQEFFNEHKPYLFIKGKNAFDGYVGYIYTNGNIVLEQFYQNKGKTRIASSAIYVMNVNDFIELSKKSRPEIISDRLCERITHHKGWEDKALKVVSAKSTLDTLQDVQIFANQIKRLNR